MFDRRRLLLQLEFGVARLINVGFLRFNGGDVIADLGASSGVQRNLHVLDRRVLFLRLLSCSTTGQTNPRRIDGGLRFLFRGCDHRRVRG